MNELKKQQNRAKRRREEGVKRDRKMAQELEDQLQQEEGAAEEEAKALQEEKDAEVAKSLSKEQVTLASEFLFDYVTLCANARCANVTIATSQEKHTSLWSTNLNACSCSKAGLGTTRT